MSMRWAAMLRADIRFQRRHGFYYAYALVCLVYIGLLHFVPEGARDRTASLLTFSDPSALGLLFAGGILLLERGQAVMDQLFVTPLRLHEYLLSKILTLALLSLVSAWLIHGFGAGIPAHPAAFSLSVALTSSLCTLLGIGVASRYETTNGFILMSQLYCAFLVAPLLGVFDVLDSPVYWALPTQGSLVLLDLADGGPTPWRTVCSATILLAWNGAMYAWAARSFERHVLRGGGGAA